MKKIASILLFILLLTNYTFGQDKNIELPKTVGYEIKYSSQFITPLFSIYVTKDKEIFFENIKLDNVTQLADTVNKYRGKLRPEKMIYAKLLLHAERSLKYSTVDDVKSALSSIRVPRIFYRTNHINDIESGLVIRNQASLSYKPIISNGVKQEEVGEEFYEELNIKKHPIQIMMDELYALDFKTAKKSLLEFKYKKVEFIGDRNMKINGKKIDLSDKEQLYQEIKDLDFYFLSSHSKLTYEDYIKNVVAIFNVLRAYKIDTAAVEISNELKKILQEKKIRL